MPVEVQRYDVNGFFILGGVKRSQRGKVSYYPDGKLVGLIRDEHEEDQFDRLFLSIYSPGDPSLAFWKLPPVYKVRPPILYSLTSQRLNCSPSPTGTYVGFWMASADIPVLGNLDQVLSAPITLDSMDMLDISVDQIKKVYFNEAILARVEESSARCWQRGGLTFSRAN